jgi:polar amino acid transport system permease protein
MSLLSDVAGGPLTRASDGAGRYKHVRIVPARHPWRHVGTLVSVLIIAGVVNSVMGNPRWEWNVFAEWFLSAPVLAGLGLTLLLTALGAVFGFLLGGALALARVSNSPLMAGLSWVYIWLFRSIPLIVLLLILNNLGYLYETIRLGVPFTSITFFSFNTTRLITPFDAAVLGLALNQAAFAAEIIRGGILSVDQGQHEAAAALGIPGVRQTFRIVLPQAMRTILPAAFNDIIGMAKGTSNVYIVAIPELFYTVQIIFHRNLEVIPLLMVATVWYLIILTVLSVIQWQVERHFARGALRTQPSTYLSRWKADIAQRRAEVPAPTEPAVPARSGRSWAHAHGRGAEVSIQGVSKSFGALKVLDNVVFDAPAGSVTVILGQSGSGKSTLLRAINHLERVDEGFISIDGESIGYRQAGDTLYELKERDILAQRIHVGMVFQNFNLFPHLTALQNIVEAPLAHGVSRAEATTTALDLLARVGLSSKVDAYPRQLSGGQQQRVAIARALALKPKVLLFDEPTSALDPELVNEVLDVIKELARSGATLIIVTHEIGFAREVADTIAFMEGGRIVESGPPAKILNQAEHPRLKEFLAKVL